MKHLVKFIVVTLLLLFCTHSFAEQKVVVLDLKYILNNSKAGKGAQDFLKKKFSNNAKKFLEMEKKLKKEENDLLTQKNALTKEEYNKKSNDLRKKVIDYQSARRASLDKITTQRAESRDILIKKIDPILVNYIEENNIYLIVDKKSTLAGKPEVDITKIIIEKLNKELPSLNLK